jgi:hypothetical protein
MNPIPDPAAMVMNYALIPEKPRATEALQKAVAPSVALTEKVIQQMEAELQNEHSHGTYLSERYQKSMETNQATLD